MRVASLVVSLVVSGCAYNAQSRAGGWIVVDTAHVRLRTSLSRDRAVEIAAELQETRDRLAGSVMGCAFTGDADRFGVTILPASEFEDIASDRIVIGEYKRMRVSWLPDYEGQIIMPDDLRRRAVQVFQHELTHHLVAACMPQAPTWLDEGLAKFLETAFVEDGTLILGLPPYLVVKNARPPRAGFFRGVEVMPIWRDHLRPVETLVGLSSSKFHSFADSNLTAITANYATSWALVHFLELGAPDLHERFKRFLSALTGDEEIDGAALFAAHLGGNRLQERLDAYLSARSYPIVKLRVVTRRRSEPSVRALSAGEAHLHWAWLWSRASGQERSARVREHLTQAKQDPAVKAQAHLLAAALFQSEHDEDGAEREVERGLAVAPDDPGLLQAAVELELFQGGDPAAPAARLHQVAKTADQICALGAATLVAGDAKLAVQLARRGLHMKRSARLCRQVLERAGATSKS